MQTPVNKHLHQATPEPEVTSEAPGVFYKVQRQHNVCQEIQICEQALWRR